MRLGSILLALAAPLAVVGDLRHSARRNHHEIAKRADASVQLHKRFSGTRWTFYDVGGADGACGERNRPDEYIVALNEAQYGDGSNCWRKLVMKIGNKQTTAVVTDMCPGCPYGGLDLTRGLFDFFAPQSVGVLSGDWWWADEAPEEPNPTPKPDPSKTKTTSKSPPPPTTTSTYHTHTTSHTPTTTSTSHKSTQSSTKSSSASSSTSSQAPSSIDYSSGVVSGLVTPTGVISTDDDAAQNILATNKLLVNMGGLIIAAAQA